MTPQQIDDQRVHDFILHEMKRVIWRMSDFIETHPDYSNEFYKAVRYWLFCKGELYKGDFTHKPDKEAKDEP